MSADVIMLIIAGASFLGLAMGFSGVPRLLAEWVGQLGLGQGQLLIALTVLYIILGCFLDGVSMIVLTLSVVMPMINAAGIDPIWFGVLVVLTLEMGLISPPVGINVFIVKSVAPNVSLSDIFRGVAPFWLAMLVTLIILIAFPQLSLFLPDTMFH